MSFFIRRCLTIIACGVLWVNTGYGLTYSTAASGNFSSPATWVGGVAPATTLNGADTILINNGHNVLLDQNILLSNALALINVNGTLTASATNYLSFTNDANFKVTGTVSLDSLYTKAATVAEISGKMTVKRWHCVDASIYGSGTLDIDGQLYLYKLLANLSGSTINFIDNTTIYMLGGTIYTGATGNSINLAPNVYDVIYADSAFKHNTGYELSGTGLRNILVNIADTQSLKLSTDLTMTNMGTLTLKSGVFALNNHNLNFTMSSNLAASGIGRIGSTSFSDVSINNNNGLTGQLRFETGSSVNIFTQNAANSATTTLGTDLRIAGNINFLKGKIDIKDNELKMVSGATITGASVNNYIITSGTGAVSADIGANSSYTYHIGTVGNYAPAKVTSKNGTVYNGLRARIATGVRAQGTMGNNMANTQPIVNATWFLNDNKTTADVEIELAWDAAMEIGGFDRSAAYVSQYLTTWWDRTPGKQAFAGTAGINAMKRSDIKSFGPFAIFDNNTVGVKNIVTQQVIKVYPNPATNVLHVAINQTAQAIIQSTTGQVVSTTVVDANNNTINIAALPAGMYYLQLKGEGINGTAKFIKQ